MGYSNNDGETNVRLALEKYARSHPDLFGRRAFSRELGLFRRAAFFEEIAVLAGQIGLSECPLFLLWRVWPVARPFALASDIVRFASLARISEGRLVDASSPIAEGVRGLAMGFYRRGRAEAERREVLCEVYDQRHGVHIAYESQTGARFGVLRFDSAEDAAEWIDGASAIFKNWPQTMAARRYYEAQNLRLFGVVSPTIEQAADRGFGFARDAVRDLW